MKIVLNKCYGGFGLSHKAHMLYAKLKGIKLYTYTLNEKPNGNYANDYIKWKEGDVERCGVTYFTKPLKKNKKGLYEKWAKGTYFYHRDLKRNDPILIEVVKQLGDEANDSFSDLRIVEIPDGIAYEITEYDGIESAEEPHRSW